MSPAAQHLAHASALIAEWRDDAPGTSAFWWWGTPPEDWEAVYEAEQRRAIERAELLVIAARVAMGGGPC